LGYGDEVLNKLFLTVEINRKEWVKQHAVELVSLRRESERDVYLGYGDKVLKGEHY
jgi:hypothetical protein